MAPAGNLPERAYCGGGRSVEADFDLLGGEGCCHGELTHQDLLDEDGRDVILRICGRWDYSCRFLVFHGLDFEGPGEWRLVDYLDVTYSKYTIPKAVVIASAHSRWLTIEGCTGGTGVKVCTTEWFEPRDGKLRYVLSTPTSISDVNPEPGRRFSTRCLRHERNGERESIEFAWVLLWETSEQQFL